MWASALLRSGRGRALATVIAGAVAVPALWLLLRDPVPTPEPSPRVVDFQSLIAQTETPSDVVALEAALPETPEPPAEDDAQPADTPETDALPASDPAPALATGPAFEVMPVLDPLTGHTVQPVAFETLEVASAPDTGDDIAVYVPGSIGKAKRKWAGGDGAVERRDARNGGFVLVGGGGHCPVPGRVIPPIFRGENTIAVSEML